MAEPSYQPDIPNVSPIEAAREVNDAEPGEAEEEQEGGGEGRIEEEEKEEEEEEGEVEKDDREERGEEEHGEEEEEGYNLEEEEEERATIGTSASDTATEILMAGFEADLLAISDLPSSSALQDGGDLSPSLSKLLALSPSSDDGAGVVPIFAKDPLQPVREALSLYSEVLQSLLQTPGKLQQLEKLLNFLMASSHCSLIPQRAQCLVFSLSSRLLALVSLQRTVLNEFEAVGAHFRTVETYRASVASQVTSVGECAEQLSKL